MITKHVIEFTTVAQEFCNYLEIAEHESSHRYINTLHKLLSLLYVKAQFVEYNEDTDGYCEQFVHEVQWRHIQQLAENILQEHDVFIEIHTEEYSASEADTMPLSEALADVYQDVKEYTQRIQIENDEPRSIAIYECMHNFRFYWGQRVLSILQEFHNLLYSLNSTLEIH